MEYRLAGFLAYVEVFMGRGGSVSASGQRSVARGDGWYRQSGAK
jgi:hypothetical protein